jgi:3-oxoacyl-[acyl-carrier protein] reductase
MDFGLKGKLALVMAGSKGLGKAVALRLSLEGAVVSIISRNLENLEETKKEIEKATKNDVFIFQGDVAKKEDVEGWVLSTVKEFGTLHVLFTNAGGPPSGGFFDFKPEDYLKAVNLNLMSTIYAVYSTVPYMKGQNWGRIIASTSISVKQPLDNLILSNVSRIGVAAFIKSTSNVLAPFGITANVIAPGYTMTERVESLIRDKMEKEHVPAEEAQKSIIANIPTGRIGTVNEFASTVAFLASEQASYITGIVLPVDGGFIKGI